MSDINEWDDEPIPADWQAMADEVDIEVRGWRPRPGQKVFGKLVDISDVEGDYERISPDGTITKTYPMLTIKTPMGRLVGVHCFHDSLRRLVDSKLKRGTMIVGDDIIVGYEGEGEARSGRNAPNIYRLQVRPRS